LTYAAEHVHLAYAATVHGIQGETTDASIVGPGVDASGLYVGMTRGRTHNEAITIARTPATVRDRLAESMLRGTPEITIDDSRHAARTELGRAAREPENLTGTTTASRREVEMRSRVARMREWLTAKDRELREAHTARHTDAARAHSYGAALH